MESEGRGFKSRFEQKFFKNFDLEAICEFFMYLCAKWDIPNLDLI